MVAVRSYLGGIRRRLLLSLSLLVTSIAAFVLFFFPARLEEQAMAALVQKAAAIRDMSAYSLSAGVVFSDTVAVEEVLLGAWRAGDVRLIEVRDEGGDRIAVLGALNRDSSITLENPPPGATPADMLYITDAPIVHAGHRVGTLTLGMSLAELRAEADEARRLGMLVAGLILLGGCIIVYTVSTLVTRPLSAVALAVKQIGDGDLHVPPVETSDANVAQFVSSFNQMVSSLGRTQRELAEANQQLEDRVAERTRQLSEAIAEQRRAQEALEASERQARHTSEMLQTLIDVAPQAIMTVDASWQVTRWNRAAEQLFGWTRDEVLGQPLPHTPLESHAALQAMHEENTRDGATFAMEAVRQRKDGTPVHVLIAVGALRDASGTVSGYIAVITDMTERKLLEEQLRQSQKMEAIGRLSGGIAHDFNNVLTVITSSASMLLDGNPEGEDRADIEAILTAARRASALTRQLLLFSRKQVTQHHHVRLNDVITGVQPMLRRLVREDIEFRQSLAPDLGWIMADPAQLEQVLLNLVLNAADAMPSGGSISIATERLDVDDSRIERPAAERETEYALLSVTDTGTGMDAPTIERIFEPFFTTKPPGQGTGLGLPTCYAVVTQLGGYIRVSSAPGAGSQFQVFIPLVTGAVEVADVPGDDCADAAPASGEATVLLVEDDEVVRRGVKRGLERLGYSVLEATDGEHALAVAGEHWNDIDIVVTDMMMPRMNGRALADRLLSARPQLPVIFISGYTGDTVSQNALIDATHAFLQKPFEINQLGQAIREMLPSGKGAGRPVSSPYSPASAAGGALVGS